MCMGACVFMRVCVFVRVFFAWSGMNHIRMVRACICADSCARIAIDARPGAAYSTLHCVVHAAATWRDREGLGLRSGLECESVNGTL